MSPYQTQETDRRKQYAGIPATTMEGNLGRGYAWNLIGPDTLFIGISNTGGSPTVCDTLEEAAKRGARTLAITGQKNSRLAKACGGLLFFAGSADDVPTKTRSYIETLMMLLAASLCLGTRTTEKVALAAAIPAAAAAAAHFIQEGETASMELAKKMRACSSFTVVGSGLHLGGAYEASLKICEMGWINSAAFETENYLHGRFRSATKDCPYVIFAPDGPDYAKAMDFLAIARKKEAPAIVITDRPSAPVQGLAQALFSYPAGLPAPLRPMVDILPAYLLGMHLGVQHGWEDPSPRHDGLVAQTTAITDLFPEYTTY